MKDRTVPEELELRSSDGTFRIRWADGHHTVYRNRDLRLLCRCASCVDELTGRPLLDPTTVPDTIQVEDAEEMGNYGLKLTWTGGHSTGIYTWERLRNTDHTAPENQDDDA